MDRMKQPNTPPPRPDSDLDALVEGVVRHDQAAEESLFAVLQSHLRTTVSMFMSADATETDDVVVETITVVFDHVRREGGFDGDLIRFAITVARNRCRNIMNRNKRRPQVPIAPLVDWVAHPERSPLDHLVEDEAVTFLQSAVDALDKACRLILRAFYFEGRSIESIRDATGLDTVQGVYYRRTVCLRKLGEQLSLRMADYSL